MDPSQNPQTPQNPASGPQSGQPQPVQQPVSQPAPQLVQITKPLDPGAPLQLSPQLQKLCEESKRKYPHLNLSPGEFVIDSVKRHPIGVIKIWALVAVLVFTMMVLSVLFSSLGSGETAAVSGAGMNTLLFSGVLLLSALFMLGGIIATYIYNANHFYLTNESVIQEIMPSLFSRNVQTVSLSNIEDASFRQDGILPHLLNYGDIRLSTEGDETTYRFNYVANPNNHISKLNNAVEAFKNGRPVFYQD